MKRNPNVLSTCRWNSLKTHLLAASHILTFLAGAVVGYAFGL